MPDNEALAEKLEEMAWTLRDSKHPQPIDPHAVYRTRAVSLFNEAAELFRLAASRLRDQEWRAIETAPKDGRSLILICTDAYAPEACEGWWDNGWRHYGREEDDKRPAGVFHWFPTHWRPLPEAPLPSPRTEEG